MEFQPPVLLRSPHLQTLLSSRFLRRDGVGWELLERAEPVVIPCRDGVRLQALVNPPIGGGRAPLVVLIHGWLGRADSPYLRRASVALHRAGFSVARLLLRDHGGTAHLNEEMFHAARIVEVVDACNWLAERYGTDRSGLMGFSLGGNFVLRLATHAETSSRFRTALAVCPVLDPEAAVANLDRGWIGYQRYFLGKWRKAFADKAAAFPGRYDFTEVQRLSRVDSVTDWFVSRFTEFRDSREYYREYTLTRDLTRSLRMPVQILAAEDDPVIPADHFRVLAAGDGADLVRLSRHGGHCAFIQDLRLSSAVDAHAVGFFTSAVEA